MIRLRFFAPVAQSRNPSLPQFHIEFNSHRTSPLLDEATLATDRVYANYVFTLDRDSPGSPTRLVAHGIGNKRTRNGCRSRITRWRWAIAASKVQGNV